MRDTHRNPRLIALTFTLLALHVGSVARSPSRSQPEQNNAPGARAGCCNHLEFLLEKTMFKVDVLWFTLTFDDGTANELQAIVDGSARTKDRERAVVERFLQAPYVDISLSFLRSISYEQFIDGAIKTSKKVVRAGLLDEANSKEFSGDMAERFAFLQDVGIRKGDRLFYTLRGDSVSTRYVDVDGNTKLNDVRVGPARRMALLGSYFAPKTNFRDGLLDLIFEEN